MAKNIDPWIVGELKRIAETFIIGENSSVSEVLRATKICAKTGTALSFTRDQGLHSSGWMKNPEWERMYHLSLSFRDPETGEIRPFDHKLAEKWVYAFFGDNRRLLWIEPPFSELGKKVETWHYRLFCDPGWQPIKPTGEPYSKINTPVSWMSWSDKRYQESLHGGNDGKEKR